MRSRLLQCDPLNPERLDFYRRAIGRLKESEIPFLVGGGYAFEAHTGIQRQTKDFDIFVRPRDVEAILALLSDEGYATEITYPHWLGKAFCGKEFIDVIFNSGNGICPVDDEWFAHAVDVRVLGLELKACPIEETIWQKSFIMERERFDGADVAHLLRAGAERIDWSRMLRRFGEHWRVLHSHLLLFGYVYPGEQERIPGWVLTPTAGPALPNHPSAAAPCFRRCNIPPISRTGAMPTDGCTRTAACRAAIWRLGATASSANGHGRAKGEPAV
jgi:hypothetical protein